VKKLLVIALAIFSTVTVFSNDKIYVSPAQVHIGTEAILINIEGSLYPVRGLFRDAQGLHVLANEVIDQNTFS